MITTIMSNKVETTALKFSQTPFSSALITLMSLFCQFLNWFAFEKLGYPWWIALITPLVLCMMYHFVQLDAGEKNGYSRMFVFIFSVAVPLLLGIIITLILFLGNSELSTFNSNIEYKGTVREIISLYSGRISVTSLYLFVFALIDIPLLGVCDKARKNE